MSRRRLVLGPDPTSPAAARRFLGEILAAEGCPPDRFEAGALAVSELVTNAVVHARTDIEVEVQVEHDVVHLVVRDGSRTLPQPTASQPLAESGRGLVLVDALARRWGVEVTADGKAVWCEF